MKRFTVLFFLLVVIACSVLKFSDHYNWDTVLYHFFMITLLFIGVALTNVAFTFIVKKSKFSLTVFHAANFLFLLLVVTFYLLILGSNYFWKKTITIKIIRNYFSSMNELMNTIPVQKWILVSVPFLVICVVCLMYLITKPSFEKIKTIAFKIKDAKRQFLIVAAIAFFIFFIFRSQAMDLKRHMHFAEEPLLIFTFGSMWQGSGEEMAFDRARYDNGLKDQACLLAINKKPGQPDHNFIIILIDGLRSDHLSFYGYKRKTTPFLDSLSIAGHLAFVKNAFSSSTNTIGGIAGLFYSKDWDKFGYNGLNIPKFLKKAGYKTHAFLTGFHKEWYGLSALYRNDCDFYYESSMNYDESFRVDDDFKTLEVIKNTKLPNNSFAFIHLLSVHHVGKKYDQFKKYLPDKIGFNVDKKEALINNYDNGILQSDYIIKEIFSKLAGDQLLENSTIFIVADHGELFGEDGKWSHGGDIHEKLLEVPLLIYDKHVQIKNMEGGSLLDIAPTIADRIGYPPPSCWQGFSLLRDAKDFTLQAFSNDENIEYPYGYIAKKDSIYTLQILDKKKNPAITKQKTNGVWRKIK